MADANQPGARGGAKSKPDLATLGGLAVALAAIVGGLLLEGGSLKDISQFTAGLIVGGGTLGAVLVSTPMSTVMRAFSKAIRLFFEPAERSEALLAEIVAFAARARKFGIISLEDDCQNTTDPFLRKALTLAIDGTDTQELRGMMEIEMTIHEQRGEAEAKVLESAGGYSPTVGIIGAVLGLIQVMKHLEDIKEVGHGIAVAFVATVYGVAIANLIFLPAGAKMKARLHRETELQELALEGVIAIVEGQNPKLIRSKLEAYLHHSGNAAAGARASSSSQEAA